MTIKIGCDPEVFLQLGNKVVSAHGLLPGTKEEPHKVDRGAVQVDGMAFEFNIDPAETAEQFNKNITVVMSQMTEMVKKIDKDMKLLIAPVAYFDKQYFDELPAQAKLLGCDPDYSYTGVQQVPEEDLSQSPFRTASGHIHIGWTEGMKPNHPVHFGECMRIATAFRHEEFFRPSTIMERKRVKYYGKNCSFRPKSYGIELRAPSNRWIKQQSTRFRMFDQVRARYLQISRGYV